MADTLARLEQTIAARRGVDPQSSYVAKLFAAGTSKIAQKVGEEAVETVIAALTADDGKLVAEASDLIFHLMVLLQDRGVAISDILDELERREGISGIAEKASRTAE